MSNFKEKNIELEVALLKMSKVKRENLCVEVALAKCLKLNGKFKNEMVFFINLNTS